MEVVPGRVAGVGDFGAALPLGGRAVDVKPVGEHTRRQRSCVGPHPGPVVVRHRGYWPVPSGRVGVSDREVARTPLGGQQPLGAGQWWSGSGWKSTTRPRCAHWRRRGPVAERHLVPGRRLARTLHQGREPPAQARYHGATGIVDDRPVGRRCARGQGPGREQSCKENQRAGIFASGTRPTSPFRRAVPGSLGRAAGQGDSPLQPLR